MTHAAIIQNLFDLSGGVACVTGAIAGLGRRATIALACAGAIVVGVARRRDALLALKQMIGEVFSVVDHDVVNRDLLEDFSHKVARPYEARDIIVHAASINTRQSVNDVTSQAWDMELDLTQRTLFFYRNAPCLQCGKRAGVGLSISHLYKVFALFRVGLAYGVSKGGVAQMTRAIAEAWSADGINANAISLGFFRTELTAPVFADPERAARNAEQTCIGRNGEPEDIDGTVLFLASNASAHVTGKS